MSNQNINSFLHVSTGVQPGPPPGQTPSESIQIVTSAAQLQTKTGAVVFLTGHLAGSSMGGGTYIHQPGTGGPRVGDWLLQPGQTVTPYHFGAKEGGRQVDSGAELQAFLDFCGSDHAKNYPIYAGGAFGTSIPLVAAHMDDVYGFDLYLFAMEPMDDVLTILDSSRGVFSGRIQIRCSDSKTLSHRTGVNGVRIDGCSRANFGGCNFRVWNGSGWGVYFTGGNNMIRIGDVETDYMGSDARHNPYFINVVGYENTYHTNIRQRTVIQLSEDSVIPSDAHQIERGWWISGEKEPYVIMSVDREANTIQVYPMIPDAEQLLGDHQLVFGGGVCCYSGGHTAKAKIGHVYPKRSGTGVWLNGQSTATLQGFTGQFCGVSLALGHRPGSSFGGTFIDSVYFEAESIAQLVHVNQTTAHSHGSVFGSVSSIDDGDDWRTLTPKRHGGEYRYANRYLPITYPSRGDLITPDRGRDVGHDGSSFSVFASNSGAPVHGDITRGGSRLRLRDNEDVRYWKGVKVGTFVLYGENTQGGYIHDLEVAADDGYTINGNPGPIFIEARAHPVTVHALLRQDNDWTVTVIDHEIA